MDAGQVVMSRMAQQTPPTTKKWDSGFNKLRPGIASASIREIIEQFLVDLRALRSEYKQW